MDKLTFTYWQSFMDQQWREAMGMIHKGKDLDQAAKEAFGHLMCDPVRLQNSNAADFKRLVNSFLINKKFPKPLQTNRVDLSKL